MVPQKVVFQKHRERECDYLEDNQVKFLTRNLKLGRKREELNSYGLQPDIVIKIVDPILLILIAMRLQFKSSKRNLTSSIFIFGSFILYVVCYNIHPNNEFSRLKTLF